MTKHSYILICIQIALFGALFWPAAEVMIEALSSLNDAANMLPRP